MTQRDTTIFDLINKEEERQLNGVELIASENFTSPAVMEATGSVLNTISMQRDIQGNATMEAVKLLIQIEQIAIDRAKALFGAAYANVQPHSGLHKPILLSVFTLLLNQEIRY